MPATQKDIQELQKQLEQGSIRRAYAALLAYMLGLRAHFVTKYGEAAVSGLYQGYMDMTYFALYPPALKRRELKVAIVFNYDTFRFEAWLAARNRKVQRRYWELFRDNHWDEYQIVEPAAGIDAIIECELAKGLDLKDPDALTSRIESATTRLIDSLEKFLAAHPLP